MDKRVRNGNIAAMSLPPIHDMVLFAHVVEAQGFTAAADRLGISKSAVSKAVASLEDHLGVRLLHRTTRKLKLTEAGIAFHEHCARIVSEAAAAELAVGRIDGRVRGRIKVNAPISFGRSFVLPVALDYLAANPDVTVDLTVQDDAIDLVATGTDLAVRVGRLVDGALVARKLADVRTFMVATKAYLDRFGVPATPEDLAQHRMLVYTNTAKPDVITLTRDDERAIVRLAGPLCSNNGEILLEAALAGTGIGIFPDFIGTQYFCDGRLQVLLPDWSLPSSAAHVVYPQGGPVTPAVRLFIDALVARATELREQAGDHPFALALHRLHG